MITTKELQGIEYFILNEKTCKGISPNELGDFIKWYHNENTIKRCVDKKHVFVDTYNLIVPSINITYEYTLRLVLLGTKYNIEIHVLSKKTTKE